MATKLLCILPVAAFIGLSATITDVFGEHGWMATGYTCLSYLLGALYVNLSSLGGGHG